MTISGDDNVDSFPNIQNFTANELQIQIAGQHKVLLSVLPW